MKQIPIFDNHPDLKVWKAAVGEKVYFPDGEGGQFEIEVGKDRILIVRLGGSSSKSQMAIAPDTANKVAIWRQ